MFLMISPFSGGGGETSEASPCSVPAGVTATQRELQVGQQSLGAGLLYKGVTDCSYMIHVKMKCPLCTFTVFL